MKWLALLLLFVSGCSPYRRSVFTYTDNGESISLPIIIPKGSKKEEQKTDGSGNTIKTYKYGNAVFYVAHLKDTAVELQPIIRSWNIPRKSSSGAVVFKGQDANDLFWREVRRQQYRFGYQYVPGAAEYKFDSATNYAIAMPLPQPR
jgi:hypothetical protein